MWIIRAYDDDDELAAEWSLGGVTDGDLKQRLTVVPTKAGSTVLRRPDIAALADVSGIHADAKLHYFLDFDSDSLPASQGAPGLRMSA